MDHKEKALELFNSMKSFRVQHKHAKKCAIVACKECLAIMKNEYSDTSEAVHNWEQVLVELEKIKTP